MRHDPQTLHGVRTTGENRAGRISRLVTVGILAVLVVLGASGLLGVRAESTTVGGSGYTMRLTYPRVARAGLDVPWNLRITHPGGLPSQFTVAISANYFDILEYQDFHPEPSGETSDANFVYLRFEAPKQGDVFTLSFDTYIQPASQIGRTAVTKLMVGGHTVAQATYRTSLLP